MTPPGDGAEPEREVVWARHRGMSRPSSDSGLGRLLGTDAVLHVPGCFDPLSAMLAEQAGFAAAYLSGFAVSAARLGQPDLGLLGMDDVVAVTRAITARCRLPLIVDIDTGFGGPLNVRRTVAEVEAAGAAAVQIEDQRSPKRCGHFEGKALVDLDEAVARVELAVAARSTPELLVVARTDAIAVDGLGAAIHRARAFAAAGADVLFVEAIESAEQLGEVGAALAGTPLLYNDVEGGRSPALDDATLAAAGVRIVIHPVTALLATIVAQQEALAAVRRGSRATAAGIALARQVVGADEALRLQGG